MAFLLYKYIRGKLREREAQKAIPTTNDSSLAPDYTPEHELRGDLNNPTHASARDSTGSHFNSLTPEEAAQQKTEARRNNIRQWKLLLGLVLPNFLAAMDVTIVAPAIPLISSHFSTPVLLKTPSRPCDY